MSTGAPADLPGPSPPPAAPTPADVLRWCAAAAPGLWFPSEHARTTGVPRDSLDEPLWVLRQAGLVHVADWVRGLGQGYALTPAGKEVLADPAGVTDIRPGPPVDEDIPPEDADLAQVPDPDEVLPPPPEPALAAYDRGELTREAFLAPRPAVLTPVLLIANVGWFFVGLVTAWRTGVPGGQYLRGTADEVARRVGAADGADLLAGEWWRLLTAPQVHLGGLHLVAALFALAMVGPVAETLWGRWRFAGLYLLAAVASGCAAVAAHPAAATGGASGAAWGVQLAVLAWLVRYRGHLPVEAFFAWLWRLGVVAAVNAVPILSPRVGWEGCAAGAAAGLLGAVFLTLARHGAPPRRLAIGLAGLFGVLLLAVGVLLAAALLDPDWKALREPKAASHLPVWRQTTSPA